MRTRDKIINAAVELFGFGGYAATTTRSIADAAGVNEVTLFRHFGTKAGLLEAIGSELAAQSARPALPTAAPFDCREALHTAAQIELTNATRFGVLAVRLALEAPSQPDVARALASTSGPQAGLAEFAAFFALAQRSNACRTDLTPTDLARGFAALTSTLAIQSHIVTPDDDLVATIRSLVDLFCDGAHIPPTPTTP